MAARTKSRTTPRYKTKYHVKNWRAYEADRRLRGDITVWFDEDAIDACERRSRTGLQRWTASAS